MFSTPRMCALPMCFHDPASASGTSTDEQTMRYPAWPSPLGQRRRGGDQGWCCQTSPQPGGMCDQPYDGCTGGRCPRNFPVLGPAMCATSRDFTEFREGEGRGSRPNVFLFFFLSIRSPTLLPAAHLLVRLSEHLYIHFTSVCTKVHSVATGTRRLSDRKGKVFSLHDESNPSIPFCGVELSNVWFTRLGSLPLLLRRLFLIYFY